MIEKLQPRRSEERRRKKLAISKGYVDLVAFSAASDSRLHIFDYLWILEADVDFSGPWSRFFDRFRFNTSDLIGFHLRSFESDPKWYHWPALKAPDGSQKLAIFIPAMRVSKRFIRQYLEETESGRWNGHPESMAAAIAQANNMSVEDLLSPKTSLGRRMPPIVNHETFGYRPVRSTSYFHEKAEKFGYPDHLYHPVKVD